MMPRIVGLLFWFNIVKLGLPFLIAIPMSFLQLGQMAGNSAAITPSGILADGFSTASRLLHNAYEAGNAFNLLTGGMFGLAAIFIILAYFIVCVHFMMALIEMWTSLRAAFLFVGFSGSRWTESYAERYISLLISTGLRLMILELFVGFGHQFAVQWWKPAAETAPFDDAGIILAFQIAVEAMLFGVICHSAPAKIAGILSGSPALSAGSITSFVQPLIQSGIAGATMIYSSVAGTVAQGARAAAGAMGSAAGSSAPPQPQPALASSGSSGPPQPKPRP
jgi:type IV secretion system protein TrbL